MVKRADNLIYNSEENLALIEPLCFPGETILAEFNFTRKNDRNLVFLALTDLRVFSCHEHRGGDKASGIMVFPYSKISYLAISVGDDSRDRSKVITRSLFIKTKGNAPEQYSFEDREEAILAHKIIARNWLPAASD